MKLEEITSTLFLTTALTFGTFSITYMNKANNLENPKHNQISLTYNSRRVHYEEMALKNATAMIASLIVWPILSIKEQIPNYK